MIWHLRDFKVHKEQPKVLKGRRDLRETQEVKGHNRQHRGQQVLRGLKGLKDRLALITRLRMELKEPKELLVLRELKEPPQQLKEPQVRQELVEPQVQQVLKEVRKVLRVMEVLQEHKVHKEPKG